jgi:hypothetical protein
MESERLEEECNHLMYKLHDYVYHPNEKVRGKLVEIIRGFIIGCGRTLRIVDVGPEVEMMKSTIGVEDYHRQRRKNKQEAWKKLTELRLRADAMSNLYSGLHQELCEITDLLRVP